MAGTTIAGGRRGGVSCDRRTGFVQAPGPDTPCACRGAVRPAPMPRLMGNT